MHKCFSGNCEKMVTWRFALCSECEKKYGHKMSEWPPYLQYLWRDEQRMRRQDRRALKNEIDFCDLTGAVAVEDRIDDLTEEGNPNG